MKKKNGFALTQLVIFMTILVVFTSLPALAGDKPKVSRNTFRNGTAKNSQIKRELKVPACNMQEAKSDTVRSSNGMVRVHNQVGNRTAVKVYKEAYENAE